MAQEWADKIKGGKSKEFTVYPHAYTPLAQEQGLMLPEIEATFEGGGEDGADDIESQMPSWVQNLSFTVGGITIGAAAVYGVFASAPPPPTPACVPTAQTMPTPLPTGTGRPAPQSTATPATTSTSTSPTSTSPSSAGTR